MSYGVGSGSVCRDRAQQRNRPSRLVSAHENSFRVLKLPDKNTSRYKRYYVISWKLKEFPFNGICRVANAISQLAEIP